VIGTKALFVSVLCASIAILSPMGSGPRAQCFGSLMLPPDFFGDDYIVRLCVHFGDVGSIPYDIVCSRAMMPGESPIEYPVYAYNLHDGIDYLEFSAESNDSIARFVPMEDFYVISSSSEYVDGTYRINLELGSSWPACGPLLVGVIEVVPVHGFESVWVDLAPNRTTGEMTARDRYSNNHYMYSPKHGGYVGSDYLYRCQEPICEEPNAHVQSVYAITAPGCSVKVGWFTGSGNRTMIRYSYDHFPAGYDDGELLVEVPSIPGIEQFTYHTSIPQGQLIYYTAFSLTRDVGGAIELGSFVECTSTDTVMTSCVIATKESTWGQIKNLYK
jgi:hypothetical protein